MSSQTAVYKIWHNVNIFSKILFLDVLKWTHEKQLWCPHVSSFTMCHHIPSLSLWPHAPVLIAILMYKTSCTYSLVLCPHVTIVIACSHVLSLITCLHVLNVPTLNTCPHKCTQWPNLFTCLMNVPSLTACPRVRSLVLCPQVTIVFACNHVLSLISWFHVLNGPSLNTIMSSWMFSAAQPGCMPSWMYPATLHYELYINLSESLLYKLMKWDVITRPVSLNLYDREQKWAFDITNTIICTYIYRDW